MRCVLVLLGATVLACGGCEAARVDPTAAREAGSLASAETLAGPLRVCSGGHVRPIFEELLPAFEAATGAEVAYQTGSSGRMLDACRRGTADLYVAADLRHVRALERADQVAAKMPLAHHRLAILVRAGNPKHIREVADLARPDLRVYVEDPAGCQIADATRRLLDAHHVTVGSAEVRLQGEAPNARSAARFIRAGHLDATFVWDSMAGGPPDGTEVLRIPPEANVTVNLVAVVPRSAAQKALAERLIRFLRSPRAEAVWRRFGFRPGPP